MKKITLILLALFLYLCQPAHAEKIQVTALSDLNIENPPESFTVQLNQDVKLSDGKIIPKDSVITNTIHKAKEAKRLKMKAALVVKVANVTEPDGNQYEIDNLYAKYTKLVDKLDASKKVAIGVANHFVKNITLPIHAVEGAIKNSEGNRAKSALKGAYDASPLSYMGKGETININNGDIIYLEFCLYDSENANVINKLKYD